jgi:hypothetical protein
MSRVWVFRRVAVFSLLWMSATGCQEFHGYQAALKLDEVAQSVDRYGFASVSTPFLAAASDRFGFDLNKSAEEFFKMALAPEGGVRAVTLEATDAQFAFSLQIEQALASMAKLQAAQSLGELRIAKAQMSAANAALGALATTNPTLGGKPIVQTTQAMMAALLAQEEPKIDDLLPQAPASQPATPSGPPIPRDQRVALGAVGNFLPPLDFPEGKFEISAREALLIASGDSLTQALLGWFMTPSGNRQRDYELFLCPVVVSVQPGWETRRGYAADVSVQVDLARLDGAGKVEYLTPKFGFSAPPIQVAGVFPLLDAQVLSTASSKRRLVALAFQFALMGFGAQAQTALEYARSDAFDAAVATALPVGSAFTAGPTTFGFRVEPRFQALTGLQQEGQPKNRPGGELHARSFPALAAVLVHRSYLRSTESADKGTPEPGEAGPSRGQFGEKTTSRRFSSNQQADAATGPIDAIARDAADRDDDDAARYDFLVFRTGVRWSRIGDGVLPPRFSEVEAWRRARELDSAVEQIRKVESRGDGLERNQLASRFGALRQMALDSQALVRVYHTKPADAVTDVKCVPDFVCADRATELTITGKGFAGNVQSVTVGGLPCTVEVIGDTLIRAVAPPVTGAFPSAGGGLTRRPGDETWLLTMDEMIKSADADQQPALKGRLMEIYADLSRPPTVKLHLGATKPVSGSTDLSVKQDCVSKPASPAEPEDLIKLRRNPAGQITGVWIDKGVAAEAELVKLIIAALESSGGRVQMKVDAHGAADLSVE